MAENLGQAQLELTVDLKAFEQGLDKAQRALKNLQAPELKAVATGVQIATKELKNLTTAADKAEVKLRTLNQVIGDIPGAAYSKISAQIARLTSESRNLTTSSEQYLTVLQRIKELEFLRSARTGRQAANAGAAAFSGPTLTTGYGSNANLPQIPLTLEGEHQNIRELQQRLSNLDYESSAYAETLRVLERAQQRYNDILNGTSSEYRQLAQQEEAAIRRAEKLASIQSYYSDQNPRAGGVRDANGSMLARGAGAAADERAYQAALRPAKELLETDLKRAQALREISQRILQSAEALKGGFGAASASNFGTTDPVQKSIRRNTEKQAASLERVAVQREALESDLVDVQRRRLNAEQKATAAIERGLAIGRLNAVGIDGRLPSGGFAPGSPGAVAARNGRFRDAASNALIGGAFPALFGQGLGASVGGAAGGGAGGLVGGQFGFGLSLVGTAAGAQFDLAIQKLQTLGEALNSPVAQFEALTEAGLLSSKSVEKQVQALIDTGREAEAAAVIQKDLAASYADLQGAKELAASSKELNRSWSELQVSVASLVAQPLSSFLKDTASGVAAFTEAIGKLRNVVPKPVSDAGFGLLRGVANLTIGSGYNIVQGAGRLINRALPGQPETTPAPAATQSVNFEQQQNSLRQLRLKLIAAEVQGQEDVVLANKKTVIELEKQQALSNSIARGEGADKQREIADQYNQQLQKINETQKANSAERTASSQRQQADRNIALSAIQRQIDAENKLAGVAEGPYKQFLKQKLAVEEANAAAQDRVRSLGAQLEELRGKGVSTDSPEYKKVLDDQLIAQKEVELVRAQGNNALIDAGKTYSDTLKDAADKQLEKAKQAAEEGVRAAETARSQYESAAKSLRGALEGSFNLLTSTRQDSLTRAARADLDRAVRAGLFDSSKVSGLQGNELLSAASQARGIFEASDELSRSQNALTEATVKLAQKEWAVNVAVNANTGAYAVQLG